MPPLEFIVDSPSADSPVFNSQVYIDADTRPAPTNIAGFSASRTWVLTGVGVHHVIPYETVTPTDESLRDELVSQQEWEQLMIQYKISDAEEVRNFLEEHANLLPVLQEAPRKISEEFGDVPLHLNISQGIDEIGGDELLIGICTDATPRDAFIKIKALRSEWWVNQSDAVRSLIVFTPEFL